MLQSWFIPINSELLSDNSVTLSILSTNVTFLDNFLRIHDFKGVN